MDISQKARAWTSSLIGSKDRQKDPTKKPEMLVTQLFTTYSWTFNFYNSVKINRLFLRAE